MIGSSQHADGLGGWSDSDTSRSLWASAAVRETFKPDELLVSWLERFPESSKEQRREAMRAIVELQGAGLEGEDSVGAPALRLPPSARRSVLADIGIDGSLSALSGVPEEQRTLAERTLADLLSRKSVSVDRDDGLMLRALKVATDWAAAAGIPASTTAAEDLGRRLERNELLQQLGGSDLNRFVGRAGIRKLLTSAWNELQGVQWFYLEGPGGIGKSLAVARFIADLLEGSDQVDAVFHLDYDRLPLQTAREVTLLQELVRQSERWCDASQREHLRYMSQQLASRGSSVDGIELAARSGESYGLNVVVDDLQRLWRRPRPTLGVRQYHRARIVVFLDSFEQVEYFDTTAARSPQRLLTRFRNVDALVICASRGFRHKPDPAGRKPVRLTQFSVREADTYLKNEASRAGLAVDQSDLRQVRSAVGRSPLALRLAVSLLEQADGAIEPSEWAAVARESPELVQAALYDRLLRRIRDRELRKLAVPGLLVRRLTAEVIDQVLAGPCGLSLGPDGGRELMDAARREGQLFTSDPSDSLAVRHRQDVRGTMLSNIERSVPEGVVNAINTAAVAYYEQHSELPMRVEELYHRLRLDQGADTLEQRWVEEAGQLLRPAMQELPPRARTYLRRRLGAASSAAGAAGAPRPDHELSEGDDEEFRLFATKELQSGAGVDFILDRWRSEGERLDTPRGDIYASALLSGGQHDQLVLLARDVMVARPSKMPSRARSAVLAIAAGLLEGRDALGDAQSHWIQALAAADESSEKTSQLSALVGCLRIRRKLQGDSAARSRDMQRGLELLTQMQKRLYQQHVLARETVAELGEVLLSGGGAAAPEIQRLIGYLAEANELMPSVLSDPSRVERLSTLLLGSSANVPDARSLGSIAHRMVYDSGEVVERLIQALRDEVDWVLHRVARSANGTAIAS